MSDIELLKHAFYEKLDISQMILAKSLITLVNMVKQDKEMQNLFYIDSDGCIRMKLEDNRLSNR